MVYERRPPKHGKILWQKMKAIKMGQCIWFNALGLALTEKIVLRGHLYRCRIASQKTSWIAPSHLVFALHWRAKTTSPSNNADITSLFCADSNGQCGRRDIRIFRGRGDVDDLYERVVQVASDDIHPCNQCMSSPTLQKTRTVPNICTVCPTWNQFSCCVTEKTWKTPQKKFILRTM